jgi:hypothetical protein
MSRLIAMETILCGVLTDLTEFVCPLLPYFGISKGVLSRNHFTKIFNNMSKPTPSGSLGRLVGVSLGKNVV